MATKTRIEKDYNGRANVIAYETEAFDQVARLACVLVERWGLVAAEPDGEDSAGRAKAKLPTPGDLVRRAFDMAEQFMDEARTRGHAVALPDLNEVNAEHDAKLKAEAEAESKRRQDHEVRDRV